MRFLLRRRTLGCGGALLRYLDDLTDVAQAASTLRILLWATIEPLSTLLGDLIWNMTAMMLMNLDFNLFYGESEAVAHKARRVRGLLEHGDIDVRLLERKLLLLPEIDDVARVRRAEQEIDSAVQALSGLPLEQRM